MLLIDAMQTVLHIGKKFLEAAIYELRISV